MTSVLWQSRESDNNWFPLPNWVTFFLNFGIRFQGSLGGERRIALFSNPVDSCSAGLVALGALSKRLTVRNANSLHKHFERIVSLGKSKGHQELIYELKEDGRKSPFVIDGMYNDTVVLARKVNSKNKKEAKSITLATCTKWAFEGEPPFNDTAGRPLEVGSIYDGILGTQAAILKENLAQSDSAVCLAGRITGKAALFAQLKGISFKFGGQAAPLARLLTVFGWADKQVSRVAYYNAREYQLDRPCKPDVVVCDGVSALYRVLDEDSFRDSDIIAIFDRLIDRNELEALGAKLASLKQWYERDHLDPGDSPRGVGCLVLKRTVNASLC